MDIFDLPDGKGLPQDGTVLALGFFDGMHRGHLSLFSCAVREARARGLVPAVFTFSDAGIKSGVNRLYSEEERLASMRAAGAERIYRGDFAALRDMSPAEFCEKILVGSCHARLAVTGEDFRFGRGASAGIAELSAILATHGVQHIAVSTVKEDGHAVSATAVRTAVEAGDMQTAARLLGRPWDMQGAVLHGAALGRTVGLPTLNLAFFPGAVHPARGVYATETLLPDGRLLPGITNIGVRPTVGGEEENCETHLLDFSGDLYGSFITVRFLARIRGEKKFESVAALAAEIRANIAEAKEKNLWANGQN